MAHFSEDRPSNVTRIEEVKFGQGKTVQRSYDTVNVQQTFGQFGEDQYDNGLITFEKKNIHDYLKESSARQKDQDIWVEGFHERMRGFRNINQEADDESCKAIFSNNGQPLYTPFRCPFEEANYFVNPCEWDDEKDFNDDGDFESSSYSSVSAPSMKTTPSAIREEIKLNERCSAVVQNHLPPKEKDPGSFLLPCSVCDNHVNNALADLGASISIMPFSMCKRLGLGPIKPISMTIEMADRTVSIPKGVLENVLVGIGKFTYPVDFVVLDMEEDLETPLILGRPLLATARAVIDVFNKRISLKIDDDELIFKTDESGKCCPNETVCVINKGIDNLTETIEITSNPDLISSPHVSVQDDKFKVKNVSFDHMENAALAINKDQKIPPIKDEGSPTSRRKRRHWCEAIPVDNGESYDLWASCNPNLKTCDGGGKARVPGKMQLWTSENDNGRLKFKWDGMMSFNDWIRIVHGNVNDEVKINIWNEIHDSDWGNNRMLDDSSQSPEENTNRRKRVINYRTKSLVRDH